MFASKVLFCFWLDFSANSLKLTFSNLNEISSVVVGFPRLTKTKSWDQSKSYTRLKKNLANCDAWTKQLKFYEIEVFPRKLEYLLKVWGRSRTEEVQNFQKCFENWTSFCFGQLGLLTSSNGSSFSGKCVMLTTERNHIASPASEKFEHN